MRTYTTQMDAAKQGIITKEMTIVGEKENRSPEWIRQRVATGKIAIPANIYHHSLSPEGIGEGLRTKINVNLGISKDLQDYDLEMEKVDMALSYGAESIMDLSNFGLTNTFRRALVKKSPAMIGTVPMYDAVGYLDKELKDITWEDFKKVVIAHAEEGVDFMTIHCGLNRRSLSYFKDSPRLTNIVSRGGSLLFAWMEANGKDNPFYEHFDELLEILRKYDVTISIGDGLRPGSLHDATDPAQLAELMEIGILTERAWKKDVQVLVEGPGHVPLNQIPANMALQKRLCHGAPFYVLGPIVTDVAPGYDHITSAIGGALAAQYGADFLCYVTPAEHLRLPDKEDVREGVIAAKIAAHAGDIAKGLPGARAWDDEMSYARSQVNFPGMFDLALDREKPERYYGELPPGEEHTCSMCGKQCAVRTTNAVLRGEAPTFLEE